MTAFWNPRLLAECRNRKCMPFAAMTKPARSLMIDEHGRGNVQLCCGVTWLNVAPFIPMQSANAYRIRPAYNPMSSRK
jgi:hypothetical protein